LIYTDGSVQIGSTACGIYSSIENSAIRLPDHTTIFIRKVIALVIAADEGLHRDKPNVIFTDSESVLQALESRTTRNPNIQQLCNIPNSPQITFSWIPVHTGIQGNEKTDQLANAGRSNTACGHNTPPCRDFIRLSISSGRSFLRTIKTTTPPWKDHPSHQDQRILSRPWVGHTRLTHTFLLQKSSPPLCSFCGVDITVRHILTECHGYSAERITCQLDHSIDTILSPDIDCQPKLLKFIRITNFYKQL